MIVDKNARSNEKINKIPVVNEYQKLNDDAFFLAIGDNKLREAEYNGLTNEEKLRVITVVSEKSIFAEDILIQNGCFVAPNSYIGPGTKISTGTIINTSAVVEHEVTIGQFSHVAPNSTVCGRSEIGNNVFLGAGSIVKDYVYVCDDVTIGAGGVVVSDIKEAGTYVGCPVRKVG